MSARNAYGHQMYPQVISLGKARVESACSATVARLNGLHGEMLKREVRALDESDLVAFMASDHASRIVRTVAVEFVCDVDLLVVLASRGLPSFVRKGALQRLGGVLDGAPLTQAQAHRLVSCLDHPDLIAYAVELMNGAGYDWCSRCTAHTADVLCAALYNSRGILEEVLIEDAFAQLAFERPDLRGSLRSCSPERVLPMTACTPNAPNVMYVDLDRVDSVA